MRECGFYILFGACQNERNYCETTKDKLNILSETQLTVKEQDFASSCNINNFDGIEKSGGWLGSFNGGTF